MSANPSSFATGQWPPLRPSQRSKLRNGSFIIPGTGERSRRHFTLRHPPRLNGAGNSDGRSTDDDDDDDENNPPAFCSLWGMRARLRRFARAALADLLDFAQFLGTPKGRGVLKCTLAYMIASLATFLGPVSEFLGRPDGKHVVATITCYFHPARSAGSMIEATLIGIIAVTYAFFIGVLSMATSVLVGSVLDAPTVAYVLVLVVFIGGGFGFIGWVKQKMNSPLVNVGSTLASLSIIGVVTKENATFHSVWDNTKIVQVLKMLVMGITTSSTINLLLWRTSARTQLRKSMNTASTSLGDMLSLVAHGFLSGKEEEFQSTEFSSAVSVYATSYTSMTNTLREAKFEHFFTGHENIYRLDKAVYKSIETLAQSVGGLRSAANTQFALLRESAAAAAAAAPMSGSISPGTNFVISSPPFSPTLSRTLSATLKSGQDRALVLSAIDEALDEGSSGSERGRNDGGGPASSPSSPTSHRKDSDTGHPSQGRPRSDSLSSHGGGVGGGGHGGNGSGGPPVFRTSSDIFELFIALLGPSIKSLAYTLSEVLREPVFGAGPKYEININSRFRQSLVDALGLFNSTRAAALNELYKNIELGRPTSDSLKADFEEVAAACGHFSFSLQAFGEEMSKYLDVLDDLKHLTEEDRHTWRWLLFWKKGQRNSLFHSALPYDDPERESLLRGEPGVKPIRRSQLPRGIPSTMTSHRDMYSWQQADNPNKVVRSFAQRLLRLFRRLSRDDIRHGLKVGIGAVAWAMFAFIPATRPTYAHWRGEWGLLTFMIVCSMTVGAANTTGFARFVGTVLGIAIYLVNWIISDGNALLLWVLGGIVAFWNFNLIIAKGKAPLGRMTLLAYNVTALYAYSLSQQVDDDDDDEGGTHPYIFEIALHRSVAVTVGILWGLIVCRVIWPISARRKFKEGLSVLYLQMGLIWKRGPLAILLRSDCTRSYLKSGEQAALQRYASRLETLRLSAASEFELRGPFPFQTCGRILTSTNRILDAFYAMSLVTQRRGHLSEGERELLLFTANERAVLCDRICHVFQVLASSLMLEYPLTDAVPSVTSTRDKLLGKIFQFRKEHAAAAAALVAFASAAQPSAAADDGSGGGDGVGVGKSEEDTTAVVVAATGSSAATYPDVAGGATAFSRQRRASDASSVQRLGPWVKIGQVAVEERDYALLYAYALVTGQVAEELKNVEREIENLYGVLDEETLLLE